ncbi:hypothetical protein [Paenibacillus flagellatus]|uniref:Glycosyltransferase 2-like domain-containing protein n=1 Tax=Paenibacillus flagellatus TaxID=2211139 RepID=A0A2V5JX13_9BACL|nr:hypothetical protein [Paenibacillus flagellatus]PYI51171.1 hypothetical protein DLM86_26135 [Paenibacillus flagellatus]
MIVGLLSIIGAYGLAIAIVHWGRFRLLRTESSRKPIHYVLITRNNAMHIEWYLRTLLFFSRLKGREIRIALLDENSEDDTLAIAERLAESRADHFDIIEWNEASQLDHLIARYESEEVVLVRLSNKTDMQNIPLFQ